METHYYNVAINWANAHRGIVCSPELNKKSGVCIEVATPPEFTKGIEGVWSPEHLFIASVSGCLMTTFLEIAENSTLDYTSFSCKAKGKLEAIEGELMISEIELIPTVVIHNERYVNKALRILKKAESTCLISNSVKTKISMKPKVEVNQMLLESK